MEDRELFRQPDLRVSDIAALLNTNRTYVSRAINRQMNLTFTDFVNGYRVEYAKRLLLEPEKFDSMQSVSEASGFSSQDTFCKIFKEMAGVPPNTWRKKKIKN
jgi:YesN/AraC family two-component response regulator